MPLRYVQAVILSLFLLIASACTYRPLQSASLTVADSSWSSIDPNGYAPGTAVTGILKLRQANQDVAAGVSVLIDSSTTDESNTFVQQLDDVSDSQGLIHVLVSSSVDATVTLNASVYVQNTNAWLHNVAPPVAVVFKASRVTTTPVAPTQINLSAPHAASTGTAESLVVAFVDNSNNPAPFTGLVHFSSSDGGAALPADANVVAQSILTYKPGVTFHTVNGTPPTVQTVQVTARPTSGTALTSNANVLVTPTSSYFSVTASPNTVAVGAPTSLVITLYNQNGSIAANPTNAAIKVTAPQDAQATLASAITMTSNPFTWSDAVTFHSSGNQGALVSSSDSSILGAAIVNVTAGSAAGLALLASTSAPAGTTRTVIAQAVDAYGNVASNYTGTISFTLTPSAFDPTASVTPALAQARAGVAQTSVVCAVMPSCLLTATDGTYSASTTLTITPGSPSVLTLSTSQSVTAGVTANVNVTAKDAYGNAVSFFTSALALRLSNQAPVQQTSTVNGGVVSIGYLPTVAGNGVTLFVDDTTDVHTVSTSINIRPNTATRAVASCPACPLTAGVNGNLVVSVTDDWNNLTPAFSGTLAISTTDTTPGITFSTNPSHAYVTSDLGVHTFTIMLGHAPSDVINVSGALTTSTTVVVNPGNYATMALVLAPAPQVAGQNATLSMTAMDAYGNVQTGYTGSGTFTTTDVGSCSAIPAQWTFAAANRGVLTMAGFTFSTNSSTFRLTVRDGLTNPHVQLNVVPGPAAGLTLMSLPPSSVAANAAFTFNAATIGTCGNTSGWTGDMVFTSTDQTATLPATFHATTADGGFHTFTATMKTVGTQNITLSDAQGVLSADTEPVTVRASFGPATKLVMTPVTPPSACAYQALTVAVEDAANNVVTNANFNISLTGAFSSGSYGIMGGNTAAAAVNGIANFNQVYFTNELGNANYNVTANGNGITTTNSLVVGASSGATVTVLGASQSAQGCVDVTYNVRNSCGDGVNFAYSTDGSHYFLPQAAPGTPFGDTHVSFLDGNVVWRWDSTHDLPHYSGPVVLNFGDAQVYPLNLSNTTATGFSSPTTVTTSAGVSAAASFQNYKTGQYNLAYWQPNGTLVIQPLNVDGTVGASASYSVPTTVSGMAVANINHDGNNFLVACVNGNTIEAWPLDSNTNALGTPQVRNFGMPCSGMEVLDLNRDNHDDFVTTNGTALVVTLNSGNATTMLTAPSTYAVAGNVLSFRATNLRNNGIQDIVMLTDSPAFFVAQNVNSTGSFTSMFVDNLPSAYNSFAVGDIDRDGFADAVLDTGSGRAVWIRNNKAGHFLPNGAMSTATAGTLQAVRDIDRDGYLDVVSYSGTQLAVTYGLPDPNYLSLVTTPVSSTVVARMLVLDFDRNGFLDLVTFPGVAGNIGIYPHVIPKLCADSLEGVRATPMASISGLGVAADFDHDNKIDVVYASAPSLYFDGGDGAEGFDHSAFSAVGMGTPLTAPAAADINGDGNLDVALVERFAGNGNYLRMYAGDGHGNFAAMGNLTFSGVDISFTNVSLQDINNDHAMDAVVGVNATDLGGSISVFSSIATSSVENRFKVGSNTPLKYLVADVDMNGNNANDVVTFSPNEPNTVHVFTFTSLGALLEAGSFAPAAQAMAVGKTSSATNVQVVTVSQGPLDLISTYAWNGTTSASASASGALDSNCVINAMRVVEFDGRNGGDLAFLCALQGRVLVQYNNGSGGFSYETNIPAPTLATQMFIADFDTDGEPDIAAYQPGVSLAASRNKANGFNPTLATGFVGGDADLLTVNNSNNINSKLTLNMNSNGFWDAAYFTLEINQADVFQNPGNGTSQWTAGIVNNEAQYINPSPGALLVASADLDRDGLMDYVSSSQGDNIQRIFYGSSSVATLSEPNVLHMGLGDFNGDGWLDIVTVSAAANAFLNIYLGGATAAYTNSVGRALPNTVSTIAIGKFTSDTHDDIVVDAGTGFQVVNYNGAFKVSSITSYGSLGTGRATALRTVDWNSDGLNDIALEYVNNANTLATINIYTALPYPATQPSFQLTTALLNEPLTAPLAGAMMTIADFDGDGSRDMVIPVSANMFVFYSSSFQGFPMKFYMEASQMQDMAVADINRDGIADLTVLASPLNPNVLLTHHVATLFGR